MAIRIVYRSSGKENNKARPSFFTKALALASFLRAVDQCPDVSSTVFLNDAPIPVDTLDMMRESGEVINEDGLRLLPSDRKAISISVGGQWPAGDVVYLSEDDYLFTPEAFTSLALADKQMPEASYFAFYATLPGDYGRSTADASGGCMLADGRRWQRAESTTCSFGARVSTLRSDRWLHVIRSRAGAGFDHAIRLAYSGTAPYPWKGVVQQMLDTRTGGARARASWGVSRAGLNLASWKTRRHRLLATPVPALATHMELPYLATAVAWDEVAKEAMDWGSRHSPSLARALEHT
jgi:hypothetical protein